MKHIDYQGYSLRTDTIMSPLKLRYRIDCQKFMQ
jgi:hypothetical protein